MIILAEIIERVTEKAILVRVDLGMKKTSFWLPLSQVNFEFDDKSFVPKSGSLNINIDVPNWLANNLQKEGKLYFA